MFSSLLFFGPNPIFSSRDIIDVKNTIHKASDKVEENVREGIETVEEKVYQAKRSAQGNSLLSLSLSLSILSLIQPTKQI